MTRYFVTDWDDIDNGIAVVATGPEDSLADLRSELQAGQILWAATEVPRQPLTQQARTLYLALDVALAKGRDSEDEELQATLDDAFDKLDEVLVALEGETKPSDDGLREQAESR